MTSTTEIAPYSYEDFEIDRDIGAVNRDFMGFDDDGPMGASMPIAREQGGISVLDAGCGTGLALMELKDQISFRANVDESKIEAVGVSLEDHSDKLDPAWKARSILNEGYADMRTGDLATIALEPDHFDIAYAYQMLLHNAEIAPIVTNILQSLKHGGKFYCDTLVEQEDQRQALVASLDPAEWDVQSMSLEREFADGKKTRIVNRFTRK